MKFRHLEFSIILFALLSSPLACGAAASTSSPEAVTNFAEVGTLTRSGELDVTQQIDYDYGSAAPHNLTYTIPVSYHDDQGLEYRVSFKLISASSGSQSVSKLPPALN
jgi:hypothetical protein